MLRHPEQLGALRRNRSLIPAAIEEILRFESSLNTATIRFTGEPVRVGDTEIPAGELVLIALLSANHDTGRFDDADQFDIFRKGNRHLAFGHGIHFCVGAPLARLEGRIAFDRLLSAFHPIELADETTLRYRSSTLCADWKACPSGCGPTTVRSHDA